MLAVAADTTVAAAVYSTRCLYHDATSRDSVTQRERTNTRDYRAPVHFAKLRVPPLAVDYLFVRSWLASPWSIPSLARISASSFISRSVSWRFVKKVRWEAPHQQPAQNPAWEDARVHKGSHWQAHQEV